MAMHPYQSMNNLCNIFQKNMIGWQDIFIYICVHCSQIGLSVMTEAPRPCTKNIQILAADDHKIDLPE